MPRYGPLVVFDGQSLPAVPSVQNFPHLVMAGRGLPYHSGCIGAASWTTLATTATNRVDLPQRAHDRAVLVLCGGYTDIVGEGQTGAEALADQESYATARRTAGFDKVIACTMTYGTATSAGNITKIGDYNTLVRANSGAPWDGIADFAAQSELSDPSNSTYFDADGLHYKQAGAQIAANTLAPVLDAVLASLS